MIRPTTQFFTLILLASFVFDGVASDPYRRKFPSMAMTNFQSLALTWSGPRDHPQQDPVRAPGVTSFRINNDWTASCLSADSFALRITSSSQSLEFVEPKKWDGPVDFRARKGKFIHNVDSYDGRSLPFKLQRSMYMPPNEQFYLVEYTISNSGSESINLNLLDYTVTDHKPSSQPLYSFFDTSNSVWMVDHTKTGGFYYASGIFGNFSSFSVGPNSGPSSPLAQFSSSPSLSGSSAYQGAQASIGIVLSSHLEPSKTVKLYSFRTLATDYNGAIAVVKRIRSQSVDSWLKSTADSYTKFLARGKQPKNLSPEAKNFYENSIVFMKHSQNPTLGTFVASFHPVYGFKSWSRDACFSAMIMDAAGYHEEAELFLRWIATAQLRDGGMGFHTTYDWWTGVPVGFVEPQYDNDGTFLSAVYFHYKLTGNLQFLKDVSGQVRNIENFLLNNIGYNGLAPADYSIWEESSTQDTGKPLPTAYFSFTQGMSYSGCFSASKIEEALGRNDLALKMKTRATQIKAAVEKNLWIKGNPGHYARSIWSNNNQIDPRIDSGSLSVIFSGLADDPKRISQHLDAVRGNLTRLGSGIGRYWGDLFFYKSKWNPGGVPEVGDATPPWGVVTMFLAWAEIQQGQDVSKRLQWMLDHSANGLPVGEAIDGVTGTFVMSSCPDLYEYAGVYVWSVLMSEKQAKTPNPSTW
eukprot:TRINITY_DN15046_c0_g1_i1.p1 TRINITY_DN15046_c0_g1~~TRINITY_DN15046_c0_g1_i1.p1  ORF type:complete len:693 (-),score=149.85 TRINITY_DN15046_c0_g1_i1:26-2104(-)